MLKIRSIESIWPFYGGVTFDILGPGGNVFWAWPEEHWGYAEADGKNVGGFVQAENVKDLAQDPQTGVITYRLAMAPEDCDVHVRIVPGEDSVTIVHEIDNRGEGRIYGGSPCLQIGRAKGFETWTFEQAKRTFLWTQPDGFTWLADTGRVGEDVHMSNKCFCQNYHMSDPEKMHPSFGRSPDLCASPLIGAVSIDGEWLAGCIGTGSSSVAHGLMNCLHCAVSTPAGPGEKKTYEYRMYFLPNDIEELVRRAQADFPDYDLPGPDASKLPLRGHPSPLITFEDRKPYMRVQTENALIEPTTKRRLTVEGGASPTFGVTHGMNAALCELEPNGKIVIPNAVTRTADHSYFTIDLTVPVDTEQTVRVSLIQKGAIDSAEFSILPAAPKRCIIPLKNLTPNIPADFQIEPANGPATIQMDCLCLC